MCVSPIRQLPPTGRFFAFRKEASNRGMRFWTRRQGLECIDLDTTLLHHLLQVAVTGRVGQIPTRTPVRVMFF